MEALLDSLERLCTVSPAEVLERLRDLRFAPNEVWRAFGLRGSCYRLLGQYARAESAFAAAILSSAGQPGAEADLCRRTSRLHSDRGEISAAISLALRACSLADSRTAKARAHIDLAAIFCSSRSELRRACELVVESGCYLDANDPYMAYAQQIELFCWAETTMDHLSRQQALDKLDTVAAFTTPEPSGIGFGSLMWLTGVVRRRALDYQNAWDCFDQARRVFSSHSAWPQTALCVLEAAITATRAGKQATASTEIGRLFPLLTRLQEHDRIEATRILRASANGDLSIAELRRSQHFFALR